MIARGKSRRVRRIVHNGQGWQGCWALAGGTPAAAIGVVDIAAVAIVAAAALAALLYHALHYLGCCRVGEKIAKEQQGGGVRLGSHLGLEQSDEEDPCKGPW